jgi:hypothetical protein
MSKEQVIVFDGEQNFIAPKTRVSNKIKGRSIHVPENVNLVDDDARSPRQTAQAQQERLAIVQPTQADPVVSTQQLTDAYKAVVVNPADVVTLGGAQKTVINEITTSTTSSTTTAAPKKIDVTLLTPPNLGLAPIGGGGGGGGQEEVAPPEEKKTNYLWILLAIGAIAYFFSKKK